MFVVAIVLAGPALKFAHFLFVWPDLAPLSYAQFRAIAWAGGFEFAYVPWVWRAREVSVALPFPVALVIVAGSWCRDRDRTLRESIAASLVRPAQLLHARSTVWLALPFAVLAAGMGEHLLERAIIAVSIPADGCLRAMSAGGGIFRFDDPSRFPRDLPGFFSQHGDDIALAAVAAPGLWMLAVACTTLVALRTFRPWESAIAGIAAATAVIVALRFLRSRADPMWAMNASGLADNVGYPVAVGSLVMLPISIMLARSAWNAARRAYGM